MDLSLGPALAAMERSEQRDLTDGVDVLSDV